MLYAQRWCLHTGLGLDTGMPFLSAPILCSLKTSYLGMGPNGLTSGVVELPGSYNSSEPLINFSWLPKCNSIYCPQSAGWVWVREQIYATQCHIWAYVYYLICSSTCPKHACKMCMLIMPKADDVITSDSSCFVIYYSEVLYRQPTPLQLVAFLVDKCFWT